MSKMKGPGGDAGPGAKWEGRLLGGLQVVCVPFGHGRFLGRWVGEEGGQLGVITVESCFVRHILG